MDTWAEIDFSASSIVSWTVAKLSAHVHTGESLYLTLGCFDRMSSGKYGLRWSPCRHVTTLVTRWCYALVHVDNEYLVSRDPAIYLGVLHGPWNPRQSLSGDAQRLQDRPFQRNLKPCLRSSSILERWCFKQLMIRTCFHNQTITDMITRQVSCTVVAYR